MQNVFGPEQELTFYKTMLPAGQSVKLLLDNAETKVTSKPFLDKGKIYVRCEGYHDPISVKVIHPLNHEVDNEQKQEKGSAKC